LEQGNHLYVLTYILKGFTKQSGHHDFLIYMPLKNISSYITPFRQFPVNIHRNRTYSV